MFPSKDPKLCILYQESDFGNYLIMPKNDIPDPIILKGEDLWTLEFDSTFSSTSSSDGIVLISPSREIYPFDFKLEFENTNNTVEYEALLLGMEEAKKKGIKMLKEKGDAKLIVKKVRALFSIKNERLKHYQNRVWDEMECFDAFSIKAMPRKFNSRANALAGSTTLLIPHPAFGTYKYPIELIHRPSVLDNASSWQVLKNDAHIIQFLEGV